MPPHSITQESPVTFFALTFALSAPFYILNALAYQGVVFGPEMGPLYISLFTLTPITAASILTFRKSGRSGVTQLLGRILDWRRITRRRWYIPILLLVPLIFLLSLGVMVASGTPLPAPMAPVAALPVVFLLFFLLAAGEEVGWMGYAFGPMQARSNALRASLLLGVIWALWHVPFFVFMLPDPVVLLAQVVMLIGTRVLVAWIFNNTGHSVFAATSFHAADNTALVTLPEVQAIAPWGAIVTCGCVLIAAVVVTMLWGPGTLTRFRFENSQHPSS